MDECKPLAFGTVHRGTLFNIPVVRPGVLSVMNDFPILSGFVSGGMITLRRIRMIPSLILGKMTN